VNKKIIKDIRTHREINNLHWMKILEIALERAPKETKVILAAINDRDRAISALLETLAK